ncbi:MAG: YfhO family protein, partial [Clostridia bacterium]|nr:YfhO family protein [Clostridia bacterium]
LPYRFAFVYIFALLVVCYRGLINLDSSETKHVGSGVAFAAGLLIILQALNLFEDSVRTVITSLLLIAVYGVVLIFGTQRKLKLGAVYGILALVMVFELTCNGILSIRNVNDRFFYADRDGYYNSYAAVTGAADELEGMEENFFRVEHLPSNTCNDNCLYNYNGLTVFSSTNAQRIVNLMDRLGYSNNGVNSHMYRCFEPATDSLLGLKYLITTSNIYNHPQLARVGSVDNDGGTLYVYENKFALPLGTVADVSLMNWNWDTENPFEVINEYYQLATGVSDVFEIIDLELEDETNFNTEYFDGRYISGYPEDYSYYANITASCDIPRDGQVYAYSEVPYMRSQTIYYTDQSIAVSESEPYVADLGIMNAGDRAAINIEVNYMTDGAITMAMLNQENFEKSIAYLNSHKFDEEIVEDGYIKGTVNTGKDGLLVLSVPYDEGWTVYVDGKKSYISPLGSALISVAMPAGKHTVEFKFMTVGLKPGAIISIVSLIVLALICLRKKILTRLYPLMPSKMKAKTMHAGGFKVNRKKEPVFDSDDLQILEDLTNNVKEEPIDDDQQDSKQAETE